MYISIIVNCYNSEKFLKECLNSILSQSYKKFELIIWDNYSSDSTKEIINLFNDERIKIFNSEKNYGLGKARELAVKKAKNNWVAFLDSDDVWESSKLQKQVSYLQDNKEKSLIYTDFKYIDEKSNKIDKNSYTEFHNNDFFEKLLKKNFICFSSIIFDKKKIMTKNIFDPVLRNAEDLDLLLNLSRNNTFGYLKEKLTYYRVHKNNLTKFQTKRSFAEWQYLAFKYCKNRKKIKDYIKKKYIFEKFKNKLNIF